MSCGVWLTCASPLPHIFTTIYGVECVQLAHFSIGDWKDISIAHFIIIIKSEVSTFPIVITFSVVVCLRCLSHHILLLITYTDRARFVLKIVFVCLSITPSHYQLSSLCKHIWRHWTCKMPVRHTLSSVWVRYGIFSQLSIIQYVGPCVFNFPISLVIERIYIYIYFVLL